MARLDKWADGEDDFSVLAESLPHLVWIAAPDGTIEYLNRRFKEYTGTDEASYVAAGPKGVVHEADLQRTLESWHRALETGAPYDLEYRLRDARDGRYHWFLARAVPVRAAGGSTLRWIGTATDIDAARRTADSLRFVADCASTLASLDRTQAITDALARIAVESFADWAFVVMRGDDGSFAVTSLAHRDPELLRYVESYRDRYSVDLKGGTVEAILQNRGVVVPEIDAEAVEAAARDEEHLDVLRALRIHSAMIVPVSTGEAPALGAIVLCTAETQRVFEQTDFDVALAVAGYAANALVHARTLQHERQTSKVLRFTAQASELLAGGSDVDDCIRRILTLATRSIADVAYMWRIDPDGSVRMAESSARRPEDAEILKEFIGDRPFHRDGERSMAQRFATDAYVVDPLLSEDLAQLFFGYACERFQRLKLGTLLGLPLHVGSEAAGSLVFARREGTHFLPAEIDALKDLARHVNLAVERRAVARRERRIARELQQALLPQPQMLPSIEGIAFDALYQSSSLDADIGGDWYDALQLPDGRIVISVGDVTGKGLGAAGSMGKLRQSLSALALYEPDPARMLDAVEFLLRRRSAEAIATAFVGIIAADRTKMTYASAGHPRPLLKRGRELLALKSEGLPIGLRDRVRGVAETVSLEGAEMLVLYTDGLIESTRDIIEGEAMLREVVASDAVLFSRSPALLIRDACLPHGSLDDAAILVVTFTGERRWSFDAENAHAAHDARSEFAAYLHERADDGDFEAAEIIFGELIGNVVRHAPGPIDVHVEWSGAYPVLHVTDRGGGFSRKPALPEDPLKESGRGLYIIESLARALNFERVAGYGMHVAVELPVRRR